MSMSSIHSRSVADGFVGAFRPASFVPIQQALSTVEQDFNAFVAPQASPCLGTERGASGGLRAEPARGRPGDQAGFAVQMVRLSGLIACSAGESGNIACKPIHDQVHRHE